MQTVYTEFHKDYTDFILTPLVTNLIFKYDAIMAANFSMTKVFFVEQLASYWIPLEINFTSKKDLISIKAMLVKKRKVESPILNNFNSILLDFKEKAVFPLTTLLATYPIPPNKYEWDIIIFKSYDQTINRLYVNDALITSASLPQAFSISSITSLKFEANEPTDVSPDTDSDSFYIQAIDTNGGVSNEAYINVVHTGVASLESNFAQVEQFYYNRTGFDDGSLRVSPNIYYEGLKPNLNLTVNHEAVISTTGGADDTFNLIEAAEAYTNVKVKIRPFTLRMDSDNNGLGRAKAVCQVVVVVDGVISVLLEKSVRNNDDTTFAIPALEKLIPSVPIGTEIRAYLYFNFNNTRGLDLGSMDISLWVDNWAVDITTIKTV